MTTEEKAKAYDKAMERAEKAIKNCDDNEAHKRIIREIFQDGFESEDEKIRKALIEYLKDYPVNLPNGLYSRYDFFTYLEKQKEHTLSTKETELNSIAFLEQLGYTCIPPSEQKPNIKSKSLAELREKVMDFFDSAELTEEVKIKDVTDGKCLFVYIDEDDGPVIGIGQRILRGMCDDIKQLI